MKHLFIFSVFASVPCSGGLPGPTPLSARASACAQDHPSPCRPIPSVAFSSLGSLFHVADDATQIRQHSMKAATAPRVRLVDGTDRMMNLRLVVFEPIDALLERVNGCFWIRHVGCVHRLLDPHEASVPDPAQFAEREALAEYPFHDGGEPLAIRQLAKVETPSLFVQVGLQVERSNGDVGPTDHPLRETPEVLQAVAMNHAGDVLPRVVNPLVDISQIEIAVALGRVGADLRTLLHVDSEPLQQGRLIRIVDDSSADLRRRVVSPALEQAVNDGLADAAAPKNPLLALSLVHVRGRAADERLVTLDSASHLAERFRFHRQADAHEHKPSGLLRDSQGAGNLARTDTVFGVGDAPHGDEPRRERERRILKDRSDLRGELLSTLLVLALEHRPGSDDANLVLAAFGAGGFAIRPFQLDRVAKADAKIAEVADGIQQGFGTVFVHGSPFTLVVSHNQRLGNVLPDSRDFVVSRVLYCTAGAGIGVVV